MKNVKKITLLSVTMLFCTSLTIFAMALLCSLSSEAITLFPNKETIFCEIAASVMIISGIITIVSYWFIHIFSQSIVDN
jgi:hypothetical protein